MDEQIRQKGLRQRRGPFASVGERLFSTVFPPGGNAAADMPFRFVFVQHGLDTKIQLPIHQLQPL